MLLQVMEQKKLIKEFPNKGWGLRGTKRTFEKAARNWHGGSVESIQNISCLFCIL